MRAKTEGPVPGCHRDTGEKQNHGLHCTTSGVLGQQAFLDRLLRACERAIGLGQPHKAGEFAKCAAKLQRRRGAG